MNLSSKIESILFFKGEPVSIKQLAEILNVKEGEISDALNLLKENLKDRGICLIKNDNKVMLGTAPEMHEIIENLKKEELSRDIGKAGIETLSIVLYKGPVRKSEIDYIRGVNSGSILRNLMIRGLVERKSDENDQRSYLYIPTFELLSFLGVSSLEELPEYDKVISELKKAVEIENEMFEEDSQVVSDDE
ncbi:MAG: SMC-Scp complex subunit ScpB [Candidatus Pacebacteria bacterium]|nr:SMC-Scp complex subunit ScpB [Candidatus Paceibacterota bacterium]